jgi:hypothetical protein
MKSNVCYLVVGYAPTKEKEEVLRKLLVKLNASACPIILVLHNKPSDHILDLVNYFIYDKNNEVVNYYPTKSDPSFPCIYSTVNLENEANERIWTQYSSHLRYHGYAALSMMFNGLLFAKTLGYEICHLVEYDTEVKDLNEFFENETLLKTASSVFYFLGPHKSMVYCQVASYNLSAYSYDILDWSKQKPVIKSIVSDEKYGINSGMPEIAFYEILHSGGNHIKKNIKSLKSNGLGLDLSSKLQLDVTELISVTPFVNKDKQVCVYAHYLVKKEDNIKTIKFITNDKIIEGTLRSQGEWFYAYACELNELNIIEAYVDGKELKKYDFLNDIIIEHFVNHSILESD